MSGNPFLSHFSFNASGREPKPNRAGAASSGLLPKQHGDVGVLPSGRLKTHTVRHEAPILLRSIHGVDLGRQPAHNEVSLVAP